NHTMTTVQGGGSIAGLQAVEAGTVHIGMSDVTYQNNANTQSYTDLVDHQVAVVAFTLVVSQDLKDAVQNLTMQEVRDLFAGKITNWKQLGGPDEAVTVVDRPPTSGTRATFVRYVLGGTQPNDAGSVGITSDSTQALVQRVSQLPGAIGFAATGFVLNSAFTQLVFPVCIDGRGATEANINNGSYVFWNYEHAFTKGSPTPEAQAFLDYVVSAPFQTGPVPQLGYFQTSQLTEAAKQTHLTP